MEDFFYAGGLGALLGRIGDLLDLSCATVNGHSLGENIADAHVYNDQVILVRDRPLSPEGGLAVLRGNLAPDGAVIKHTAADARLHRHRGPAVVFRDYNDMTARIDDPSLAVTPDSVLVLQHAGPIGGPGMPEWGMLPIPRKLLAQGVRDMLRVSDARMSGTAYGACVPTRRARSRSSAGRSPSSRMATSSSWTCRAGVSLSTCRTRELARRRARWQPAPPIYPRGYGWLYSKHITQANHGCDFDFLAAPGTIPEPEIH
jgi:dihydroxy-acid dehydratase